MTADERIEKLLNRFGQTISDLPKADVSEYAYSREHLGSANMAAWRWHENHHGISMNLDCEDYICHLWDVIDRMETALETAANDASYQLRVLQKMVERVQETVKQ